MIILMTRRGGGTHNIDYSDDMERLCYQNIILITQCVCVGWGLNLAKLEYYLNVIQPYQGTDQWTE